MEDKHSSQLRRRKSAISSPKVGSSSKGVSPSKEPRQWVSFLFSPVDNSSLIVFRILWGVLALYHCYRYIRSDFGRLELYDPSYFHPKYYLFEWVQLVPGFDLRILVVIMLLSSIGITLGLLYRFSAAVYFLSNSYLFLLDRNLYQNHYYLNMIISFWLIFMPAHAGASVDVYLFPSVRSNTMPCWVLYVLRGQQVLVYFFAAFVKVNDDWLRGEPLRHWLPARVNNGDTHLPEGIVKAKLATQLAGYAFSYAGLLLDGAAGFLLLLSKGWLFIATVLIVCCFHIMNKIIFFIGVFPYMMLALTTMFFPTDWPRRVLPLVFGAPAKKEELRQQRVTIGWWETALVVMLCAFAVHQIAMPLRHFGTTEGNVDWHEDGFQFAWRMKLRQKDCKLDVTVRDTLHGSTYTVGPEHFFATDEEQSRTLMDPESAVQLAHFIADFAQTSFGLHERPQVFFKLRCSLNYRRIQPLFKDDVDLAAVDWHDRPYAFLLPVEDLTEKELRGLPWNWDQEYFGELWRQFQAAGDKEAEQRILEERAETARVKMQQFQERDQAKANERLAALVQRRLQEREAISKGMQ